jgi:recombinational DNA repair ATPase RecF
MGLFFSLLFHPGRFFHFREFPAERRSILDRFLSFIDPEYLQALKDLRVVLSRENRLLNMGRSEGLGEWNHLFAAKGYAILVTRRRIAVQFNERLSGLSGRLTRRQKELTLSYQPSLKGRPED